MRSFSTTSRPPNVKSNLQPFFSCDLFPPLPQMYRACVFMFLLSVHGGIQLGKYSVYNTLCLQLTFLINCSRNTAISSLIAGRIQLYISSLSRTQKLWLPNLQRKRVGRENFYIRVTGEGSEKHLKWICWKLSFGVWVGVGKGLYGLTQWLQHSRFAELLF